MDQTPLTGKLSYNGRVFTDFARITVRTEFLYNRGETAVIARKYFIKVSDFVSVADTASSTDSDLDAMRLDLGEPRGTLTLNGMGAGDLDIGEGVDIEYGPKPKVVQWIPDGGKLAAYVVWECETVVSNCSDVSNDIVAFETEVAIARDDRLLQTIMTHGWIKVRSSVGAGGTIEQSADEFRHLIDVASFPGFKRKDRYLLNWNRTECEFFITDTELDTDLPEGMIDAGGYHDSYTETAGAALGPVRWVGVVAVNYTPARGFRKSDAVLAFKALVSDRIAQGVKALPEIGRADPMFLSFRVREAIHGRGVLCSTSWTYVASLGNMIGRSGLFRTVPGSSPIAWAASMSGMNDPLGETGILAAGGDTIVSLCDSQSPRVGLRGFSPSLGQDSRQEIGEGSGQGYLAAKWGLTTGQNHGVLNLKRSSFDDIENQSSGGGSGGRGGADPFRPDTYTGIGSPIDSPNASSSQSDVTQVLSSPELRCNFHGFMLRAGIPCERPKIDSIGGSSAIPCGDDWFDEGIAAEVLGTIIYYLRFAVSARPRTPEQAGDVIVSHPGASAGRPERISPDPQVKQSLPGTRRGGRGGTFSNGTFSGSGPTFANGQFGGSGPAFRGGITNPFKKLTVK